MLYSLIVFKLARIVVIGNGIATQWNRAEIILAVVTRFSRILLRGYVPSNASDVFEGALIRAATAVAGSI